MKLAWLGHYASATDIEVASAMRRSSKRRSY